MPLNFDRVAPHGRLAASGWHRSAIVCLGLAACLAVPAVAGAQGATRTTAVTRIGTPLTIDGVLDESIWLTATRIGDLVQRQPETGQPPTERTDITLLYDDQYLYIGVLAYDAEPDRIIGTQMSRDVSLNADDRIEILLDTFRDQRSAFYFATNPAGALVDGLAFANGQLNTDWDAIWQVRTTLTAEGWTAEFAIPFKSLSFPAGHTVWGFNISRSIYRKLEEARWSGARIETQFLQVSEAGEITNLQKLSQGIGLDLRPFMAGRWLHFADGGRNDTSGKPGLDLFYNITPSLRLTATVNTDFGETEVDARQINLERFSVSLPEKRAFFLEDAGVFSFASTGPPPAPGIPAAGADVYPFFSRQIGLLSGQEVPLDVGAKLTGRLGRNDIGLLSVRTRDLVGVADAKHLFVGRVKRNLFQQSYVGAIFTDGHPAPDQDGQTYGADLRLASSRFLGGSRNFEVNAYGVRSVSRSSPGDDWSYGVSARYPNDLFDAQVTLREVQRNFQPGLGFVQRRNVRMVRVAGSFNPRPRNTLNMQQMFHDVFYTRFTRLDTGEVESWNLYVTLLDWHLQSGDSFHGVLDFNPTYERLFEPFQIAPGVTLLAGEYRFTRFKSNLFATAARRPLSANVTVYWGNYWSGKAEQVTTVLTYRLQPHLAVSVNTNQTFARLPEGHFTARIVTANVNFSVSPRLSFFNLLQYDNRSRNLGWQSRLRWTLQPGNDLFVAFNQGWIHEDGDSFRFATADSKLSAKFQYSVRF